ncbi:MAG: UbiA family prenyltransferase, partial [Agromyces sp.]
MSSNVPLVVDLDGTYLKTDTLHELLMLAIRRPGVFFRAFVAYTRSGKAAAKRVLAENLQLDVSLLPMNPEVAEFATTASQDGRLVLLASGADAQIVNAFIDGNHSFSEGISSDGVVNLTGARKAEALVDRFGRGGFDYVGNERADIDVWAASRKKYLASNSGSVPRSIRSIDFEAVLSAHGRTPFRAWVKAIRPHQSAKNILVFLPLLAAHQINSVQAWLAMLAGYLVFSMMASSVYLLNDALDLSSDRQHTKKRRRPMASGDILPLYAVLGSLALAVLALGVGLLLGIPFFSVLLFYTATTIAYSFWLKRITLVDVLVLALLYMVRIFAGAALAGIELSFWFIAVTTFLFISLAFAKRFAEVSAATHATAKIPGRGYQPNDG